MENGAKNVGSYHSDFLCMISHSLIYGLGLGVEIGCDDDVVMGNGVLVRVYRYSHQLKIH